MMKAFLRGVSEHRSVFSTYYTSQRLTRAHDLGRAVARRLSLPKVNP